MAKKEKVATEAAESQPAKQAKTGEAAEPTVAAGYQVALMSDGRIAFDTFGDRQGLIELLGLHKYAGHRLDLALDMNQNTGTAVSREILKSFKKVFAPQSGERAGAE